MTVVQQTSADERARVRRSAAGWMFTIVSFAAMMIATAHVLRTNWPANGMPLLAWQSHLGAIVAMLIEVTTRALKIQASAHAIGAPIQFGTSLRVCLAGDFAAALTPARSGAERQLTKS